MISSTIGGICGIGGGVIIKPVLDALNVMDVRTASFLSGLTVMSMSGISVVKRASQGDLETRKASVLSVGAILGGAAGNMFFQLVCSAVGKPSIAGIIQSALLAFITLLTLLYTLFGRERVPSFHAESAGVQVCLGFGMGMLSSFLGIGGGPINIAVFGIAFSMDTKKAAINSLYVIMCSQAASLILSLLRRDVPEFSWYYLLFMVSGGIAGGMIGSRVSKRITSKITDKIFAGLMGVIVAICIFNAVKFGCMLH